MSETSGDLLSLKRKLDLLNEFKKSWLHQLYINATEQALKGVEVSILQVPPRTEVDRALCLELHGQRNQLLTNLSFFETTRVSLEEEVARLSEPDNNPARQ